MERTVTLDIESAKMIREWADCFVKTHGLNADCTKIEAIINPLVRAFNTEEKPRLRVAAGSTKEADNG